MSGDAGQGRTRIVVAVPYVEDGMCEVCDRRTPQLYAWHYATQRYHDVICGWCVSKAWWIITHASDLEASFLAPDEEGGPAP